MRWAAAMVHVLTALGALCALFATLAIGERAWEAAFAWLALALVIDGIDGPLARRVAITERLPRFSGERLDLVIDYLTYVFVPALALLASGRLAGASGTALAAAILISSLYHFSDLKSKAEDMAFVGFPAVWNFVAFYLFAFDAGTGLTAAVVALCVALTFVPMKWVHPVRVVALRPVTLALSALGAAAALAVLWTGFADAPWLALAVLLTVAAYAVGLAVALSVRP